jgi:tetratricopeptide (TPR) repeat protein
VDAVTYFARGLGSALRGDPTAAAEDAEKLGQLRDALLASKDTYWAEQVAIQQLEATAWIALDEGRSSEALTTLRDATNREDATDKAAVTPGPLKPARELLAEMLLQLNRPTEALKEFEQVMRTEPNRFRATSGAAHAASVLGDHAKARTYYASLVKICERGDTPGRPELQGARDALAQQK